MRSLLLLAVACEGGVASPSSSPASCAVGDAVSCSGTSSQDMCAGNQCCGDLSICPSADESFAGCPEPKNYDCTPSPRIGSYVVIGDWGWDSDVHGADLPTAGCQNLIAAKLDETMKELGDVNFIINVGDSFYPDGVESKTDPQWDVKWRNRYSDLARSVPWFSVYGNHDFHHDPGVCSDVVADGAQINGDINDLSRFYMPDYNWHIEWPALDMEVIGLELNHYMDMWQTWYPASEHKYNDCIYTACEETCYSRMKQRAFEAFELFKNRTKATQAKNVAVFSHYPTDYFWDSSADDPSHDFLDALRDNSRYNLAFFGGHRHSTDYTSTTPITPNQNWLVGGGGGWSCDTDKQGIVVGEVFADGSMTTRDVLVDAAVCCPNDDFGTPKTPWYEKQIV